MSDRRRIIKFFMLGGMFWTKLATSRVLNPRLSESAIIRVAETNRNEGNVHSLLGPATEQQGAIEVKLREADLIPVIRDGRLSYVISSIFSDSINQRSVFQDYTSLRRYAGALSMLTVLCVASDTRKGTAGIFVRDDTDSMSRDDGGVVLVAENGVRWKRQFSGPVSATWWGCIGDGKHDDSGPLQAAFDFIANHALSLELESGDYRCSTPLVLGSNDHDGKQRSFKIGGQGQVASVGKGTRIFYDGPPAKAILTFGKNADRHILLEGFQVECARPNLTEFGILFADTTFSQNYLTRVSVVHAKTGYGVLRGTGSNGEFLSFEHCIASYVERFFFQEQSAGQAFEPLFVNCHANLKYDEPSAIFELGGQNGGFGLTVINQSCSFVGKDPGFARRHVSAFIKLGGTSDNITVIGGRVEGLSALLVQTGASGSTASVTFSGLTMAGMSTNDDRPVIDSSKLASANGITFSAEKCTFQLDMSSGKGDFSILIGKQDGSSYYFDRCGFRMRGKFSFVGGGARNNAVEYVRCMLNRVFPSGSVSATYKFDKLISERDKFILSDIGQIAQFGGKFHYKSKYNLLSEPAFGAVFGNGVRAPSPWVHLGKQQNFGLLVPVGNDHPGNDEETHGRTFEMYAGSGVSQIVNFRRPNLNFGVHYNGIFAIDGGDDSIVAFALSNPSSGAIYDERIVTAVPISPLYVSLFAAADGGALRFTIQNRSKSNVSIKLIYQNISLDVDGIVDGMFSDQ